MEPPDPEAEPTAKEPKVVRSVVVEIGRAAPAVDSLIRRCLRQLLQLMRRRRHFHRQLLLTADKRTAFSDHLTRNKLDLQRPADQWRTHVLKCGVL